MSKNYPNASMNGSDNGYGTENSPVGLEYSPEFRLTDDLFGDHVV
jgi:hypothetical protein